MMYPGWIAEYWGELQALIRQDAEYKIDITKHALNRCGSDLERAFLITTLQVFGERYYAMLHEKDRPVFLWHNEYEGMTRLTLQAPISIGGHNYRADFLIEYASRTPAIVERAHIVVEIDGHNFHERTKEQARHDRKRDRLMTQEGYTVFRFTGSEIYAEPYDAAMEVHQYVHNLQQQTLKSYGL